MLCVLLPMVVYITTECNYIVGVTVRVMNINQISINTTNRNSQHE